MNETIKKRNELLAKKLISGLESRNMKACYAADKEEALKIALATIRCPFHPLQEVKK